MNSKFKIVSRMNFLEFMMKTKIKQKMDKANIHPGQPFILKIIGENPGISQTELAEKLRVTPASVAVSTKRLEKQDLIIKKEDEHNLRLNHIYLTEKGEEIVEYIKGTFKKIHAQMFENLTEEELSTLISLYNKMIVNLSDLDKEKTDLTDAELCSLAKRIKEEDKND